MIKTSRFPALVWLGLLCISVLMGCGSDSPSTPDPTVSRNGGDTVNTGGQPAVNLPTVSIGNGVPPAPTLTGESDEEPIKVAELKPGSPEWMIREIMKLRIRPLPKTDDVDKQRSARHTRNQEIIELATKVIGLTHEIAQSDAQQQRLFNVAVHQLMDAHLQLALQGDRESIDALYENADSLYKRNPKSEAAMDAAYTVVKFAHSSAQRFANEEPRWLNEFTRRARLFAANFPQKEYQNRAISLLFAAGQSCELHGMTEEAVACYNDIRTSFPDSPQSRVVVSFLRRLNLQGKSLQLAGPTIEGGFANIDDYRGKPVLVAFWSTDAKDFREHLPTLVALEQKYRKSGFEILGINLNENEPDIDAFLEQNPLQWSQIFYADPERRGWNSPVAVYYGVREIPTYWLVAPDGTVVDIRVDPSRLEAQLQTLLQKKGSKPVERDNQ